MAYYDIYQWAWLVYLIAALGMYVVAVKFTKYWISENLRNYTRLFSATILFTPVSHTMDANTVLAPAFIVTFGDLLTYDLKAAMTGLLPLLAVLFLGTIVLTAQALYKSKR